MILTDTPDHLRAGDRIPDLDSDGPLVLSVGQPIDADDGTSLPVTLEGVDEPRLLPLAMPIRFTRPDDDATAPEPQ